MSGSLFERGKALEERFFGEKDKELLAKLRQEISDKESREALSAACGISDGAVLDAMLKHEVSAETLTSLSLVPLVAVAWADGVMENNEREAIMKAATSVGIATDSASYEVLASWLDEQPGDELVNSWKEYIGSLKETLDDTAFNQVKANVMGRAKDVAQAAGGFLGIGKTSDQESAVIADLENSF